MINGMKIKLILKQASYLKFFILVLFLTLYSLLNLNCSKEQLANAVSLEGTWVEARTRLDTLEFYRIDASDFFELKRGYEIQNGNRLPKYGTGMYTYQVSTTKIRLKSLLSSNSEFLVYPIELKSNTLQIGDFYNASSGKILTFTKLN